MSDQYCHKCGQGLDKDEIEAYDIAHPKPEDWLDQMYVCQTCEFPLKAEDVQKYIGKMDSVKFTEDWKKVTGNFPELVLADDYGGGTGLAFGFNRMTRSIVGPVEWTDDELLRMQRGFIDWAKAIEAQWDLGLGHGLFMYDEVHAWIADNRSKIEAILNG